MDKPDSIKHDFLWVDNPLTLEKFAQAVSSGGRIGIDTEADSLHHYRESVCLGQFAQNGKCFILDPLSKTDLTPLWPTLAAQTWIIHGADFDLRMLRRIGAPEPAAVFDTMIAAQLAGLRSIGYAALVEQFTGNTLTKASQKSDWSRRPLTPTMLNYAVEDTLYLEPIADKLTEILSAKGRLEWHRQSSARIVRTSRMPLESEENPEPWRLRGSNTLSGGALAVLKELWHWREAEAERADLPTFKILSPAVLLDMADWADARRSLPGPAFSGWPHRMPEGRLKRLAEALERGRSSPPIDPLPRRPRPKQDPKADARYEKIKIGRDKIAAELELDPTLLAPKNMLIELARDPLGAPEQLIAQDRWCVWQAELFKPVLARL
jgi:ribonuclease D